MQERALNSDEYSLRVIIMVEILRAKKGPVFFTSPFLIVCNYFNT